MEVTWNPWHGCTKYSEGCRHCYVYRRNNIYNLPSIWYNHAKDSKLLPSFILNKEINLNRNKIKQVITSYGCKDKDHHQQETNT